MPIEQKLFLTGLLDKSGKVSSAYSVIGSTYLLLAGLVDLQENGYIKINAKPKGLTGLSLDILKTDTTGLSNFQQAILSFVVSNPELKDPAKNANFLIETKVFEMVLANMIAAKLIAKVESKFLFFKWSKDVLTAKGKAEQEQLIEEMRANLLEDGEIDIEVIAQILILDKLDGLKRYFSEYEHKELKAKVEKLKSQNPDISTKILNLVSYITTFDDTMILLLGAAS
jgi:hypothetical protein